jgi:hypothetical protein
MIHNKYKQHYYIGIPLVQMGESSVQCDGDCIICGSIVAVYKLKWV